MKVGKKEAAQQLARELYAIAHMSGGFNDAVEGLAQQYGRDRVLEALSDLTGQESSEAAAKRITAMTNMLERVRPNPAVDFDRLRKKAFLATKKTAVAAKDTSIKGAKLTAWKGKETGLAARVAALEQCVSSLQVSDSSSPTLRDARAALASHRRTAKYNPGGKQADSFALHMNDLLGNLIEIKVGAWVLHWSVRGTNFYGAHLLLERVYTQVDELIDVLGEKIANIYGKVDYQRVMGTVCDSHFDAARWQDDLGTSIGDAKATSDLLQDLLRNSRSELPLKSISGLDDYLMSLNNSLETFEYLVRRSA